MAGCTNTLNIVWTSGVAQVAVGEGSQARELIITGASKWRSDWPIRNAIASFTLINGHSEVAVPQVITTSFLINDTRHAGHAKQPRFRWAFHGTGWSDDATRAGSSNESARR